MKDNKELLKTTKQVVTFAVSVGVGIIVKNIVRATTPAGLGLVSKAFIGAGSLGLGYMLSDKTAEYTDQQIDKTVEEVKAILVKSEDEETIEEIAEVTE